MPFTPYPPDGLRSTYGAAVDATPRPGRLAPVEESVIDAVDAIVATLGANPKGAYTDVTARLTAMSAGQTGFSKSVRAATTLGISYTLATDFHNGSVLDGVSLVTGNRVLINIGTVDSGVYTVNASGAPTRAADFSAGADFPGQQVAVREGTKNAGQTYMCANSTPPTIGTTAISFFISMFRAPTFTVAAVGSPLGPAGADFVCDGTADEYEFNLLLFLLSISATPKAEIRLTPGTYTFAGPVANVAVNNGDALTIRGSGRETTRVARSANAIAFDFSGTASGAHASVNRLADMTIVGSVTPHTSPALRLYYADRVQLERVDFVSMTSVGIQALEWWESVVSSCRFDQCGSKGSGPRAGFSGGGAGSTGGNPAVLILGDTAASGFGHTVSESTNHIRFRDCTFDGLTDGAVQVHGNGAAEDFGAQTAAAHHDLTFDACRINVPSGNGGWAPHLGLYKTHVVRLNDLSVLQGDGYAGATAQNVVNFDTCSQVNVTGMHVEGTGAGASVRTWLRFSNTSAVNWDALTVSSTFAPSVAIVEFAGTCNQVRRGKVVKYAGSGTAYSGTPTTEYRTSGTATILSGTNTIVVTHRLPRTPVNGEVFVVALNDPSNVATAGMINHFVDTYTATQFTINCHTNPGATGFAFAWTAEVADG